MNYEQLSLSPELFTKAFPFHIILNRNIEIIQVGQVLQRIAPEPLVNSKFDKHFQINRPSINLDFDIIKKKIRSLFILQFIHKDMQLKGQFMYQEEGEILFFLGSPWVTDVASLSPLGIKMKDFAIHDPIADFLFLLQAKNTALNDADKLTSELKQTLKIKEDLTQVALRQRSKLEKSLQYLQKTQTQLIHAEKMSSLGLLVAGVAHEINNPITFISSNLNHVAEYMHDLIELIKLYQKCYEDPSPLIKFYVDKIDLDFLLSDIPKMISSLKNGAGRISQIVLSLRNFSRLDESELKSVDIHEGIDSTLLILGSKLKENSKYGITEIIKNYGEIPLLECYPGQLNQVFMNIISNAIDAVYANKSECTAGDSQECHRKIIISTESLDNNYVLVRIADNGPGIPESVKNRVFDPFFTTKPVGQGTGLGLSISHQIIVEKHHGNISCTSEIDEGTEFIIEIPISLDKKETDDFPKNPKFTYQKEHSSFSLASHVND
ncbi:ATP-binding protein [Mastigocoleus testarum]|uniref:ATP-binding protein n=1 Tax=Mastigocoleus testarum TaxID=996925 RepID=UPI0003F6A94E|nr:ATP-binding protein [Mastigocoleus testarum]